MFGKPSKVHVAKKDHRSEIIKRCYTVKDVCRDLLCPKGAGKKGSRVGKVARL